MKLSPYFCYAKVTFFLFITYLLLGCSSDSDLLIDSDSSDLVSQTVLFDVISDAYLQDDVGFDVSLVRLEENKRTSFLKFDLSSIQGNITKVDLLLTVESDAGHGRIEVSKARSNDWSENDLSANNAPQYDIDLGSIDKEYRIGEVQRISLSASDIAPEEMTFVLNHKTGNDLAFASKEHPNRSSAKLEITYESLASENQGQTANESSSSEETTSPEETTSTEDTPTQGSTSTEETTANTNNTGQSYYVTEDGSPNNNGLTEATAWSIQHAFTTALAGDIVYIKAGNYGNVELEADNSGMPDKPIKFIGYTNTPGDVVSNAGSTFQYGNALDASKMPLLDGINSNGVKQGTGIAVTEPYVHIENIQITRYSNGVITSGNDLVLKNIIVTELGTQNDYKAYDGFGMKIHGHNSLIENCFVLNATAEAIKLFDSDYSVINYCQVYADNPGNPTDYYFLLTGGTNNTLVQNSLAERAPGLQHGGHGFDMKDLAEYNTFRNCTARLTNFELNFSGVKNNIIEDCAVYGEGTEPNVWHANIFISNGANNNLIRNTLIQDTWTAITLVEQDDGYVGPGGDRDLVDLGFDNVFENVTIQNTNRMLNIGGGPGVTATARNFIFRDCTITNFDSVAIAYFGAENFVFENCSFTNGNKLYVEVEEGPYGPYSNFDVTWDNCSWTNVNFNLPPSD